MVPIGQSPSRNCLRKSVHIADFFDPSGKRCTWVLAAPKSQRGQFSAYIAGVCELALISYNSSNYACPNILWVDHKKAPFSMLYTYLIFLATPNVLCANQKPTSPQSENIQIRLSSLLSTSLQAPIPQTVLPYSSPWTPPLPHSQPYPTPHRSHPGNF